MSTASKLITACLAGYILGATVNERISRLIQRYVHVCNETVLTTAEQYTAIAAVYLLQNDRLILDASAELNFYGPGDGDVFGGAYVKILTTGAQSQDLRNDVVKVNSCGEASNWH